MIPMLHKEFVEKYHWLTNQEFLNAIAVGQITPGPFTVMNALMGYKIHGLLGAILAMISSSAFHHYRHTGSKKLLCFKKSTIVNASFRGIRPTVIGLLAAVALSLGKASLVDPVTSGIAILSFIVIAFTKIDPTFVIIGAGTGTDRL